MILEYELKTLENVLEILHPAKLKRESLNASFIGKHKRIAHIEKERIKMQFIQAGFEPGGEERIGSYVRQHQRSLIKLADIVYYYLQPKGPGSIYRISKEASVIKFYKEISNCIEWLLNFIEHYYSKYFDLDIKMPEECRRQLIPEIKNKMEYLQKDFIKMELPADLLKIISEPIEDSLKTESVVTYREMYFLRELQSKLLEILKSNKNNYEEQITTLLFYLNFNSLQFFNFCIIKLEDKGKKCKGAVELIEFYSFKIKLINQQPAKPGLTYQIDLPSIRDQIGIWITEELYFLEKQRQLLPQEPLMQNIPSSNEPKVHTSLSVAHLSLALKLLIDAKVITNKNSSELIKMVARNFRTDRREQISEDSLRNKAYSVEPGTLEGMRSVIIELMNLVRSY